jgi:hypothetical protein
VITYPKIKKISDVCIGEKILTEKGRFKEIKNISIRKYEGEMIRFRTKKINIDLKVTPEHPIFVAEKKDSDYIFDWKEAKNVNKNDLFVIPRYVGKDYDYDSSTKDCIYCESKKIWKRGHYSKKQRYECPVCKRSFINRYRIAMNKLKNLKDMDFCYILGLFFADGNANIGGGKIRFAVQKKHKEKIRKCLEKFFEHKTITYDNGNFFDVTLHCRKVAKFFDCFGKKDNKSPPLEILDLPIEYQKKFLEGYIDGDGHRFRKNLCCIATISKDSLYVLQNILFNINIIPSITVMNGKGNKKELFIMTFSDKKNLIGRIHGRYVLLPLSKIDKYNYNGEIFNLNVSEDETFVTLNSTVHNCALDEVWRLINSRTPMSHRNKIVYDILGRSRKRNVIFCFTSQLKNAMDKNVVDVLDFISKPSLTPEEDMMRLDIFMGNKATAGTFMNAPRFITAPFMKLYESFEEVDMELEDDSEIPIIFQPNYNHEHGFCCQCKECGTKFFKTYEEAENYAIRWWEKNWQTVFPPELLRNVEEE